ILVEGFMGDDWDAYREAFAWLRDFANLKNTERGRVTCGSRRFTPQAIESVRERARVQQLRKGRQRRRGDRRDQFERDTSTHLINTQAKIGLSNHAHKPYRTIHEPSLASLPRSGVGNQQCRARDPDPSPVDLALAFLHADSLAMFASIRRASSSG